MFDPNLCGALVRIKDPNSGGYLVGRVDIVRADRCSIAYATIGYCHIHDVSSLHVIELKKWQSPLINWDTPRFISGLLQPRLRGETAPIIVPPEGGFYKPVSYTNTNSLKKMPYMAFKEFRSVVIRAVSEGEKDMSAAKGDEVEYKIQYT